MKTVRTLSISRWWTQLLLIVIVASSVPGLNTRGHAAARAQAGGTQKPNILFIMADDIGWMQVGLYHRGIGLGETPNIDRIGKEGAMFTSYYAMQSCTSGRNAFFTGMYPLRTGMIPPQLPGSPSYLRAASPGGRRDGFCRTRRYCSRDRAETWRAPGCRAADTRGCPAAAAVSCRCAADTCR